MLPSIGRAGGPGGKFFGLLDLRRRMRMIVPRHSKMVEANITRDVWRELKSPAG